ICEVKINYQKDWRYKHRETLKQAYSKAPFCKHMLNIVDSVYANGHSTLDALTIAALDAIFDCLGLSGAARRFVDIRELGIGGTNSRRVLDTVLALGGDTCTAGHGARNYLDHVSFEDANVRVEYMDYR